MTRLRRSLLGHLRLARARSLTTLCFGVTLVALATACHTDAVFTPALDSTNLFWNVRLNEHAVQLNLNDPADTLRLIATPYTPYGQTWTPRTAADSTTITWTSSDSSKVGVSQTGLLIVRNPTSSVLRVIIRQRVGNVTRADTCQVRVVAEATPRTLTTMTFHPIAPDSAKVAEQLSKTIQLIAKDAAGIQMTSVVGYVTSSDTTVAKPSSPWTNTGTTSSISILGQRVGTALISVRTLVYGVVKTDTFTIRIGYPLTAHPIVYGHALLNGAFDFITGEFNPEVGVGAVIEFENGSLLSGAPGGPMDVIFDDSAAAHAAVGQPNPGTGNILAIPADTGYANQDVRVRYRQFDAAGTYTFHIPQFSLSGAIVVKAE